MYAEGLDILERSVNTTAERILSIDRASMYNDKTEPVCRLTA